MHYPADFCIGFRFIHPSIFIFSRFYPTGIAIDEEMLCKCFDKCCKAFIESDIIPVNLVPAAAAKQVV